MGRGIVVPILGDADSVLRAINKTIAAGDRLGASYKKVGVTAEESARLQIAASTKKEARLRSEVAVYRQIASTATRGSKEQITATNLATQAEKRLSRSLSVTAHESSALSASTRRAERDFGRATRGALAGSGVFRGLGRSLAFASGGFLAFASAGQVVRSSVDAATEASAAQRQLAAQFKASGLQLRDYQQRIVEASLATSQLSGFTETDLKQAFTTAFRGSQNVAVGLRIQSVAADVARGRHVELAQAAIALTKAYGGQTTALRRLGIQVPTNLSGMRALEFVSERFAGQAQAGTTAQERFAAALHNTEISIGSAILPTLNKYLGELTKWLDNTKHQEEIHRKVNKTVSTTGQVLHRTSDDVHNLNANLQILAHGWSDVESAIGGATHATKEFLQNKVLPGAIPTAVTGEDVRLRSNAFRPNTNEDVRLRGAGALATAFAATAAGGTARTGLHAQLLRSQLALAKAQITATSADDKRVLSDQARIIKSAIAQTTNLKKLTALERQLGGIENQLAAIDKAAADARQQAADNRKRRAEERRAAVVQALQINIDRAGLTKGLGDDVKATAALLATLKRQLRLNKNSLDVQQQIVGVEGQLAGLEQQQRDQAAQRRQAAATRRENRQFRILGLGPGGAALTPTRNALKKELGSIEDSLKGTFLDTNANRSVLDKIRKLMKSQLGGLSADVRSTVKQMLDDLKGQLNGFDGFNLTQAEKRRRFLDKTLSGPIGGAGRASQRAAGTVVHVHQTIVAQKGESADALARRQHFRARQAFAH